MLVTGRNTKIARILKKGECNCIEGEKSKRFVKCLKLGDTSEAGRVMKKRQRK